MSVAYAREIEVIRDQEKEELFLGPVRVVEVAGTTPIVEVAGERVRAEMALAYPYQPVVGDELLVIRKAGSATFYVIGVVQASGDVALRFLGNVKLHAMAGKLELVGDEGVLVRGQLVEILGSKLHIAAKSVMEKADSWYKRVRETLDVHAGEKRELVDGELSVRADRASTVTRGVVTINGKEVHLG